jgi:metallophosphoesterase (TIGR00282 family)
MPVRILFLGEIVSRPGIFCIKSDLQKLKEKYKPDLVVANGDGTTGGYGLGKAHAMYLRKMGIDVITGGDQTYYKKDMVASIDQTYHVLRPANYPPGNPGRGWRTIAAGSTKVGVISLLGLAGFSRVHLSNPFTFLPEIVKRLRAETPIILLDFHSVTTAEKATMALHSDGLVSAMIGTGLRVLTADAEILPGGTAMLSDAGRTGSIDSVIGYDPKNEIAQFMTAIPEKSADCWSGLEIQGAVVDIGDDGKATAIDIFRHAVTARPDPTVREDD